MFYMSIESNSRVRLNWKGILALYRRDRTLESPESGCLPASEQCDRHNPPTVVHKVRRIDQ
jgi:hypothetical protein